jgi:hypothetical protein
VLRGCTRHSQRKPQSGAAIFSVSGGSWAID